MEIKVLCDCGQKFAFDVEPVNGRMPFTVNCPTCNADGTAAANTAIAQIIPDAPDIPVNAGRLQINRPVAETPPPIPPRPTISATPAGKPFAPATAQKQPREFSLGLGILGAVLGAAVGAGLMFAFYEWAGFRFPLLGVGIGLLTGFGARLLARGTDHALGFISGGVALLSVVGTLFLMYGEFPMISIISVIVSVSMAYRIAS